MPFISDDTSCTRAASREPTTKVVTRREFPLARPRKNTWVIRQAVTRREFASTETTCSCQETNDVPSAGRLIRGQNMDPVRRAILAVELTALEQEEGREDQEGTGD